MRRVDLHTHSTASDGTLTPTELVAYGRQKGLAAIALTDHDTIAGLAEAMEAGGKMGIEVVPGIETTTVVDGCDVHLVCLLFDPEHTAITERLHDLAASRDERNRSMVQKLNEAGLAISWDDVARYEGRSIGKAHIGSVLIQKGYAADLHAAMRDFMNKGAPGYVKRRTPTPEDFINSVHRAGGLAFVAHINQIDREDWVHGEAVTRQVIEAGADGLETLYCEYNDVWRKRARALRREYGLLASGGSDFHGGFKRGLDLGCGYGDLAVPEVYLKLMKKLISN